MPHKLNIVFEDPAVQSNYDVMKANITKVKYSITAQHTILKQEMQKHN